MSAFLDNPILERLPLRTLGYKDYIERVKDLCIQVNTKTQIAFINPDYKYLLIHNNLKPDICEEELTWEDVLEILKLEIERWNKINSKLMLFTTQIVDAIGNNILELMNQQREKEKKNKEIADDILKKYEVS